MLSLSDMAPAIRAKPVRAALAARIAALLLTAFSACTAAAEPIQLKLSFFESEDSAAYRSAIKPFVDGIHNGGSALLSMAVYPNGILGTVAEQPRLLLEDKADIAFIIAGLTPYRFPDNEFLGQPGLFRDLREATLVATRLTAANELRGLRDFFVIGAFAAPPTLIHSRKPVRSLADLAGLKIRVNNPAEAEAMERFGAIPTVGPVTRAAFDLEHGAIDAAAVVAAAAFDFGVVRVTKYHYLLKGSMPPLLLLMNRRKFESLPDAAKTLIRRYSGSAAAEAWIPAYTARENEMIRRLKQDPEKVVVEPSPADQTAAEQVYRNLIATRAMKNAWDAELLRRVQAELAKIRSGR